MLILPLWRWGYHNQKDAIDVTLISIVGAIVSLISIGLAIVFQHLSSKSGKQIENYVQEIRYTVVTIKTLAQQISKTQENETTKLISALGNIATQLSKQTWKQDDSH